MVKKIDWYLLDFTDSNTLYNKGIIGMSNGLMYQLNNGYTVSSHNIATHFVNINNKEQFPPEGLLFLVDLDSDFNFMEITNSGYFFQELLKYIKKVDKRSGSILIKVLKDGYAFTGVDQIGNMKESYRFVEIIHGKNN